MKKCVANLIFLLGTLVATGQPVMNSMDSLRMAEMQLKQFSDSIMKGSTEAVRQASLSAFNPVFLDLLSNPATFTYPFDSLQAVSKISSPDKLLRIYTWIYPSREDGTYKHFGILQRIHPETRQMKIIGLMEIDIETAEAEINELKSDSWYGAAYYDIIQKKINKKVYYFLLGWKGNDRLTTKKVIDVLYFDIWNNVTFGAPFFSDEKKRKKYRVIFEYNAQAVMLLRYEKKKKMIVFDHLSPSSPSARGQYRHYGPDFTYDGFQFKKGMWHYKSNLDLRNPGDRK